MPPESIIQAPAKTARIQRLLLAAAIVAYGVAVAFGAAPALSATLLSALALAALAAALFAYVEMRLGPVPAARLGGRAQVARRRWRALAFGVLGVVYITLVAGALVTNQGALWSCLALPVCLVPGQPAASAFESFATDRHGAPRAGGPGGAAGGRAYRLKPCARAAKQRSGARPAGRSG